MNHNYVVIMAGGIGSRFWPYSRAAKPKQFLDVLGTGRSLLQMTFDRFFNLCPAQNIYVITNKSYKNLVQEQLPELGDDQVLLEPTGKNTAPAVAYPAFKIQQKDPGSGLSSFQNSAKRPRSGDDGSPFRPCGIQRRYF